MISLLKFRLGAYLILLLPALAGAGWIPISPHDKAAPGTAAHAAGWRRGDWKEIEDVGGTAGRVLRTGKFAAGSNVACIRLPVPIPADSDSATLSFRFRMRTAPGDGPRVVWGLSVRELLDATWGAQAVQAGLGVEADGPFLKIRSGAKSEVLLRELQTGPWYRVWVVLDNRAGQQSLYVSTAPGPAGPENLLNDRMAYRSDAPRGALEYFTLIRDRGDPEGSIEVDDLFLDPTGENLTAPVP